MPTLRSSLPFLALIFLAGVSVALIPGTLATDQLVGWDGQGHFESWREWRATRDLSEGIHTYSWKWGAGATLMKFYPPVVFLLVELIQFIFGLDDELSYRVLMLATSVLPGFLLYGLALLVLRLEGNQSHYSSWYALLPALGWFIFPRQFVWTGMGVNAITGGMLSSALGISTYLFTLSALVKYVLSKRIAWVYLAALSCGLSPLVHLVSAVAHLVLVVVIGLRWPKLFIRIEVISAFLFAGLLSAVWLLPVLHSLWLVTSGPTGGITGLPKLILPLRFDLLLRGEAGTYLLTFLIGALALAGVAISFRRQVNSLGFIFFVTLFLGAADYFDLYFADRFFHFYRLFPFFYSVVLSYSALTLAEWQLIERPFWRYALSLILALGLCDSYFAQRWHATEGPPEIPLNLKVDPYNGSLSAWKDHELAQKQYDALQRQGYKLPQRVAIETEGNVLMDDISGAHSVRYMLTRLGVHTLGSLYVEGTPTWRVGGSAFCAVSYTLCWGPHRYRHYQRWFEGPHPAVWKTFEEYGVAYAWARSPKFKKNLRKNQHATLLDQIPFGKATWELWRLQEPRPLVFHPNFLPGLYLEPGASKAFEILSDQHFLHEAFRHIPIFHNPDLNKAAALELACRTPRQLSAILIREDSLEAPLIQPDETCGVPVISFPSLKRKETVSHGSYPSWPDPRYSEAFAKFDQSKIPGPKGVGPKLGSFDHRTLQFISSTQSPVIVNGGFDSDWNYQLGPVFASSPYLRMGVFSRPVANIMEYKPDRHRGGALSLIGLCGFLSLALMRIYRDRS